jgi:hypothetical protein
MSQYLQLSEVLCFLQRQEQHAIRNIKIYTSSNKSDSQILISTKTYIYKTLAISVLTCGSEAWMIIKQLKRDY